MTRHVHVVAPTTAFTAIVRLIEENHVGAVPVMQAGRVVGIVSKSDLLPKIERFDRSSGQLFASGPTGAWTRRAGAVRAWDLMSAPAVTIAETATIGEAARAMRDRAVRRLPVVNSSGVLRGIVTRSDLLRVFLREDDEIRQEIVHRILPRAVFDDELPEVKVDVVDGIVRLGGRIRRRSDVELLAEIVEHLDGVVKVDATKLEHAWNDVATLPH
jgi:CBS domain-containing protein